MKVSVTKIFTFEAAHHLPDHDGQCRDRHGHSYRVELTFSGPIQDSGPQTGMVYDFGRISQVWKQSFEPYFDHRVLNDSLNIYPTAENLAFHIFERIRLLIPVRLDRVRVWETATGYAEVTA